MLEVPTGPATVRPLRDAGYTVGLLAAAILSGYGLLAPERLGLVIDSEPPVRIVGAISHSVTGPASPGRLPSADTSAKPGVSVARPELAPSAPRRTEPATR